MDFENIDRKQFLNLLWKAPLIVSPLFSCTSKIMERINNDVNKYFSENHDEIERTLDKILSERFQNEFFNFKNSISKFFQDVYEIEEYDKKIVNNLRVGEYIVPNDILKTHYGATNTLFKRKENESVYLVLRDAYDESRELKIFFRNYSEDKQNINNYWQPLRTIGSIIISDNLISGSNFEKYLSNIRLQKYLFTLKLHNPKLFEKLGNAALEIQCLKEDENYLVQFKDIKNNKKLGVLDFYGNLHAGSFKGDVETLLKDKHPNIFFVYNKMKEHAKLIH